MTLDILDELAGYLQSEGVGTKGTNVFVNKIPAKVNNAVGLFGATGFNIGQPRDIKELQFPRFQVFVQNVDYNDAADKFQEVRTALHNLIGVNLPVGVNTNTTPYIRVMRCHAEQEGGPIGEDDQGRSGFSANFAAEYHHYDPTA
jgi:hypothetical protein